MSGEQRVCGRPFRHEDGCLRLAGGTAQWLEDRPGVVALKPEAAAEVSAVAALVDEGFVVMVHTDMCNCDGTERLTMVYVRATTAAHKTGLNEPRLGGGEDRPHLAAGGSDPSVGG